MKKNKVIAVILITIIMIVLPLKVFAKSFELNINFDGENITMTSETPDMDWTLSNLLPGQSDTSTVTVRNSGTQKATLETSISIEEDTGLLEKIDLTVTDKSGTEVYSGKYTDLKTISKELSAGESEVYTVKTSLNVNAGNEYQNKQYKLNFNFTATGDVQYGTLTVRYVDENGKDLEPATIDTQVITKKYNLPKNGKDFPGYEFTGVVDGQLSGYYQKEGTEVVYHYKKVKYGDLSVKWIVDDELDKDGNGNKVLKSYQDTKKVGTHYKFQAENFTGYKFTGKIDGEAEGDYSEGKKEVIFHYQKDQTTTQTGKVIVVYVDENGNELGRQEETNSIGEVYTYTEDEIKRDIPGYEYKGTEGELTGTFKSEDTIIYCKYESIKKGRVIIVCIDENNHVIKQDIISDIVGMEYNLGEVGEEIEGYTFLGVDGETSGRYREEDIVVTYKYKRNKPQGPSTNKVVPPKTGDNILIYIAIIGIVLIILIVILLIKRKGKNGKEQINDKK